MSYNQLLALLRDVRDYLQDFEAENIYEDDWCSGACGPENCLICRINEALGETADDAETVQLA